MDSAQDIAPVEPRLDPLTDFDWAAHWRRLVEQREAQAGGPRPGYWDGVAPSFPREARGDDPLLAVLEAHILPTATLIDVGAGTGRHVSALAGRLDWVTAVEPSEAMRERIPAASNLTIIASSWEDAEVAPADLVICSHVLYGVIDVVPFVRKLDASARKRAFISLRDSGGRFPGTALWEELTGQVRRREPVLADAYNLLHWMGIRAGLVTTEQPLELRYPSLEAATDAWRHTIGGAWHEARGRAWVEKMVLPDAGGFIYRGGTVPGGVLHWRPQPR